MSEGNTNKPVDGTDEAGADEPADAPAEAAATAEADQPADVSITAGLRSLFSGFVPKLAIIVAVIATLIAGALWWQYRQFYVELAGNDEALRANLEETRASLRRFEDELGAARAEIAARDARIAALSDDLTALPVELRALGRRVEALQGGQFDARAVWLREQAEYYLVLANTELGLGRRLAGAIEALELADEVLRELGDPGLAGVRAAITAELQALQAIDPPDLEGIALDLRSLMERAPELPMRAQAPENFGAPEEDLDEVEPGIGRLLARTRGAVLSIVRVERQEEAVGQLLTESERRIVRRQLTLELQAARTALLDGRQAEFRASLVAADGILNRDFNREAQSIVAARELLGEMVQVELEPRLPDISDSLSLLRNAPGGE